MSNAARNPPYRYEPAENGSFIVTLGDDLLGGISPRDNRYVATDTLMVTVRRRFTTRKAAADALLRAFEKNKARGDL